jgi:hypothetical protein
MDLGFSIGLCLIHVDDAYFTALRISQTSPAPSTELMPFERIDLKEMGGE